MAKTSKKTTEQKEKKTTAAPKTSKAKVVSEAPIETVTEENITTTTKAVLKDEAEDKAMISKLHALWKLQQIDTKINKLKSQRGMLPMEVKDLEDTVEGLSIRITKIAEDIKGIEEFIKGKNISTKEALDAIKKYEAQKDNVKNNREYESLASQISNQELDIRLFEKEIKLAKDKLVLKNGNFENVQNELEVYKNELSIKINELDEIVAETTKEEEILSKEAAIYEGKIDERLLIAYKRIRNNAKNGLAVVTIERNACGGCFNKIPPQRQLDIRIQKKIIVCEYCGRILVDAQMFE